MDVQGSRQEEDRLLDAKVASGEIDPEVAKHKRYHPPKSHTQAKVPAADAAKPAAE